MKFDHLVLARISAFVAFSIIIIVLLFAEKLGAEAQIILKSIGLGSMVLLCLLGFHYRFLKQRPAADKKPTKGLLITLLLIILTAIIGILNADLPF